MYVLVYYEATGIFITCGQSFQEVKAYSTIIFQRFKCQFLIAGPESHSAEAALFLVLFQVAILSAEVVNQQGCPTPFFYSCGHPSTEKGWMHKRGDPVKKECIPQTQPELIIQLVEEPQRDLSVLFMENEKRLDQQENAPTPVATTSPTISRNPLL